jgi:hypothetical protein
VVGEGGDQESGFWVRLVEMLRQVGRGSQFLWAGARRLFHGAARCTRHRKSSEPKYLILHLRQESAISSQWHEIGEGPVSGRLLTVEAAIAARSHGVTAPDPLTQLTSKACSKRNFAHLESK